MSFANTVEDFLVKRGHSTSQAVILVASKRALVNYLRSQNIRHSEVGALLYDSNRSTLDALNILAEDGGY